MYDDVVMCSKGWQLSFKGYEIDFKIFFIHNATAQYIVLRFGELIILEATVSFKVRNLVVI